MKSFIIFAKLNMQVIVLVLTCSIFTSCDDDVLTEAPKDFLAPGNTFVDKEGLEAGLTALYANARSAYNTENANVDIQMDQQEWQIHYGQGLDIGYNINNNFVTNYETLNSSDASARRFWEKFYSIVKDANVIISGAGNKEAQFDSEVDRNEILAEARFFRAFAYRGLVWFYGDVPIIDGQITNPRLDFVRDPAADVLSFILDDLEFASQNLPAENPTGARATKAAADYLLAETYIATQRWDDAVAAADRIINDPQYGLMLERFGSMTDKPGDVYWDLFRLGNQDRSSGNRENILAWQYEFNVDGGSKHPAERSWGPFLERLKTPDNLDAILKNDELGRPVTFIRITPWVETGMWDDFDNDIRNSVFNVRREFFINNPESAFFGQEIEPTEDNYIRNMFPYYQKFTHPHGHPQGYDQNGAIFTDWYVFRVAGAYLLRAEAYLGKGNKERAAADINVVRERANASPVSAADVNIDYILDERARELIGEEHRRITLSRTGKILERTRLLNPISGPTIQDFNVLFPIPQTEIDANKEAELTQNPGY